MFIIVLSAHQVRYYNALYVTKDFCYLKLNNAAVEFYNVKHVILMKGIIAIFAWILINYQLIKHHVFSAKYKIVQIVKITNPNHVWDAILVQLFLIIYKDHQHAWNAQSQIVVCVKTTQQKTKPYVGYAKLDTLQTLKEQNVINALLKIVNLAIHKTFLNV